MKASYWYNDNWNGDVKSFPTLREAKTAAKKEDGVSITIFTNKGGKTNIAEIVKANGYTYP